MLLRCLPLVLFPIRQASLCVYVFKVSASSVNPYSKVEVTVFEDDIHAHIPIVQQWIEPRTDGKFHVLMTKTLSTKCSNQYTQAVQFYAIVRECLVVFMIIIKIPYIVIILLNVYKIYEGYIEITLVVHPSVPTILMFCLVHNLSCLWLDLK